MLENHIGFIRDTVSKCLKTLIAERDCFYENCASPEDGLVDDADDREALVEMDSLIDDMQKLESIINHTTRR